MAIDGGAYQGISSRSGSAAAVEVGGAWPLGRRSVVRAEQQLHRDVASVIRVREVGQGGRQGYPDGSLRAHRAGEESSPRSCISPCGDRGKELTIIDRFVGDQHRQYYFAIRKRPVAARVEREHQRCWTILSEGTDCR